jgi:hypothetical protein
MPNPEDEDKLLAQLIESTHVTRLYPISDPTELDAPPELSAARQRLRDEQAKWAIKSGYYLAFSPEPVLVPALEYLSALLHFEVTDDPAVVRRGRLKFQRDHEERRAVLATDIIRRVCPGCFEDPNYLALLAYQAASIEYIIDPTSRAAPFLLGTAHSPEMNGFAETADSDTYVTVVLSSALVDFMYQCAKSVIAAFNPRRNDRGGVSFGYTADHVDSELAKNTEPIERLYSAIEAYFFHGYPRFKSHEVVPDEHHIPLSHLVAMSERWTIAHEFGHGLAPHGFASQHLACLSRTKEEEIADDIATILTSLSAAELDGLPPHYGLAGGEFALTCLDIYVRSYCVLRYGRELPDTGDAEHPGAQTRRRNIIDTFCTCFDISFANGIDVRLLRPGEPHSLPTDRLTHEFRAATAYSDTLLTLWDRIRPRLLADNASGRRLHRMWV